VDAICTIIAKSQLAQARVLATSLRAVHSDLPFYVLLADQVDGFFDPAREAFQVIELDRLAIPDSAWLRFSLTAEQHLEAVKPYFFSHLLVERGVRRLLYLGPDIFVLARLDSIYRLLDKASVVLVADALVAADDGWRGMALGNEGLPDQVYSPDVIALAESQGSLRLLESWQEYERLGGLGVDGREPMKRPWLELAPALFKGVHILRDPAAYITWWQLGRRRIGMRGGRLHVDGRPAILMNFRGLDHDWPDPLGRQHPGRYLEKLPLALIRLYQRYIALLYEAGYETCRRWPYAFDRFEDGTVVAGELRRIAASLANELRLRLKHPFGSSDGEENLRGWLMEKADDDPGTGEPPVPRVWHRVYQLRPDLRAVFPDLFGRHRRGFCGWVVCHGRHEYDLHAFVPPDFDACVDPPPRDLPFGVNLWGHLTSEKGVGEVGRSVGRALEAAGVPCALTDVRDSGSSNVVRLEGPLRDDWPYALNVVALNGDATPSLLRRYGDRWRRGRRNIAAWVWELEEPPHDWLRWTALYDEIWVPSSFVARVFAPVSACPVTVVPHCLDPEPRALTALHRTSLGLPQDAYVFLFICDFHSFAERKNPLGLIRAFRMAFSDQRDVFLLVKTSRARSDPLAYGALLEASRSHNVCIVDCVLSPEATQRLYQLADCYVSLHRTEGFGLTMAEAMMWGKPVIATAYGGHRDFVTQENAYLVPYKLVEIQRTFGPYRKGAAWAEPDLEAAASLMRHVYLHRDEAAARGERGRRDVLSLLHPSAIGERVKQRLLAIAAGGE
jgi:glycosyltransferase involved in cell wall biosynthesis